jgi:glucose/mannose-6-phosphate isomerase
MKDLDRLDDIKYIKEIDKSDMGGILLNFSQQYQEAYEKASDFACKHKLPQKCKSVNNIVISGMGGSAVGGDLLRSLFAGKCSIPIVVNRNYSIPGFVNEDTLFIAVSYSGNTEETLSAFGAAVEKRAKVVSISSGGRLEACSEKAGGEHFPICFKVEQPRCAFGHLLTPMMVFLSKLGLIPDNASEVEDAAALLSDASQRLAAGVPVECNKAKQIAKAIYGKLPVIYASQNYFDAVAMRWKTQFNENAEMMAFYNVIPEMNHNEIVGWGIPEDITRRCVAIFLCDDADFERIRRRLDITSNMISEISKKIQIVPVQARGNSPLAKALYLIYVGDFVSYYLAILNGFDPMPVERINILKKRLGLPPSSLYPPRMHGCLRGYLLNPLGK